MRFIVPFVFFVVLQIPTLAHAEPGSESAVTTTLTQTDEGPVEVKTFPGEMCGRHLLTRKPCGTYMEFYLHKAGEKAKLLKKVTYLQFLGFFDQKPKEKKDGLFSRIFKAIGGALVSVVKILVPGAAPLIDLAKTAFDAINKVATDGLTPDSAVSLGQMAKVADKTIVE
ncbi:MAG: hypothetical protein HY075_14805 [Deltaproteobacteria bacterium]|nr:hypothetical protein [Deltaproteobacteria bacterium]